MTLAIVAAATLSGLWLLMKSRFLLFAASAPALMLAVGAAIALATPGLTLPADITAAIAEAGLAALVFAAAAQLRVSTFARRCPVSFRLTLGGAPLFLVFTSLAAFVMLPQLSLMSSVLLGAALMLNGSAFDRRAVTDAPAPGVVKAAVRNESAAILAFGAPIAALIAGAAVTAAPDEPAAAPLLACSLDVLQGFTIGGVAGWAAAALAARRNIGGPRPALIAGAAAFLLAALIGANAVIAAGAAGLLWGEQSRARMVPRLRIRQIIEQSIAPTAFFLFGFALAARIFQADLLTVIFAAAAVTIMRAGPRLAALQASSLPRASQGFLAWFGGAPGAASALFAVSLLDDPMIVDHEALLTVSAVAITAGIFAARVTSRPLANAFLRQTANARRRQAFA